MSSLNPLDHDTRSSFWRRGSGGGSRTFRSSSVLGMSHHILQGGVEHACDTVSDAPRIAAPGDNSTSDEDSQRHRRGERKSHPRAGFQLSTRTEVPPVPTTSLLPGAVRDLDVHLCLVT